VGSPQKERKVKVEEEKKDNTKMESFRLEAGFEPTTYCFSHEYISDCNNLASEFHLSVTYGQPRCVSNLL